MDTIRAGLIEIFKANNPKLVSAIDDLLKRAEPKKKVIRAIEKRAGKNSLIGSMAALYIEDWKPDAQSGSGQKGT